MSTNLFDLSEDQARQYVDAETVFLEALRVRKQALQFRGGMLWREQAGRAYLIRTNTSGAQKSLGPASDANRLIYDRFVEGKEAIEDRQRSVLAQLRSQQRLNKALRIGRAPTILVRTLNALDESGLAENFMTIGTHALFAYETAAAVRFQPDAMATRDIDLLFDTRKRLSFMSHMKFLDSTFIGALRKADPSFKVKWNQKQTAINKAGFEVDVVRRLAQDDDGPEAIRLSDRDDDDDLWPVQIGSGERILGARKFAQMVVDVSGHMAMMTTMDPLVFVKVKRALAGSSTRDPYKRRKDQLQADLVEELVTERLPHLIRADPRSETGPP